MGSASPRTVCGSVCGRTPRRRWSNLRPCSLRAGSRLGRPRSSACTPCSWAGRLRKPSKPSEPPSKPRSDVTTFCTPMRVDWHGRWISMKSWPGSREICGSTLRSAQNNGCSCMPGWWGGAAGRSSFLERAIAGSRPWWPRSCVPVRRTTPMSMPCSTPAGACTRSRRLYHLGTGLTDKSGSARPRRWAGAPASPPLPVGLVAITKYQPGARWQSRPLSQGQAMLALLGNTVPARRRPRTSLATLRKVVASAAVVKGVRGEAEQMCDALLSTALTQ